METSKELYKKLQEASGFKKGDTVQIGYMATSKQFGWGTVWTSLMDSTIGLKGVIYAIDDVGIDVRLDTGSSWNYPFFSLIKIESPKFSNYTLNSQYTAKVYSDRVEVGCQTFTIAQVHDISALAAKISREQSYEE